MIIPRHTIMRLLLALAVAGSLMACGADQAASGTGAELQVLLSHCAVQPVLYGGEPWEVQAPPFDATNAPKTFSGYGTFDRAADALKFSDRNGAQLVFTPDDGTPNPYNCS